MSWAGHASRFTSFNPPPCVAPSFRLLEVMSRETHKAMPTSANVSKAITLAPRDGSRAE
jgi:hypothetical protein